MARGKHRRIQVHCKECGWFDESAIKEVLNIEEDIQGADILTFICPTCGKKGSSRRYG